MSKDLNQMTQTTPYDMTLYGPQSPYTSQTSYKRPPMTPDELYAGIKSTEHLRSAIF